MYNNFDDLYDALHEETPVLTIDKAVNVAKTLADMNSKHWASLGNYAFDKNNLDLTFECYIEAKKSFTPDSKDPWILNNLGELYLSRKNYEEAGSLFEEAIQCDESNIVFLENKLLVLEKLNKKEDEETLRSQVLKAKKSLTDHTKGHPTERKFTKLSNNLR